MECPIKKCGLKRLQKIFSSKWKITIIMEIKKGPVRFNQLSRLYPEITQATLAKQLDELEASNIIIRHDYNENPPKVDYALTKMGTSLANLLDELNEWSINLFYNEKNNEDENA